MEAKQAQQDQFAIVELFGHTRIAGRISEQTFGGAALVRIDVPEVQYKDRTWPGEQEQVYTIPAHTRSFSAGAIFAINWCDEAAAKLAAMHIRHRPIEPYQLQDGIRALDQTTRRSLIGYDLAEDGIPL